MQYDFDTVIDRRPWGSSKWAVKDTFGRDDILPMWVADMDFPCAEPIVEAIKRRAEHPIYGYTVVPRSLLQAVVDRMKTKYDWVIKPEWIVITPGVVPALNAAVKTFCREGDGVVIQPPVYPPFAGSVVNNSCALVENQLVLENGRYRVDFDDLEAKFKERKPKLMILCSPHNPVGRVWTKEELLEMGRIVLENKAIMVSDEIHGEIIFRGKKQIPFASLNREFEMNSITCIAPSKTFNIPGLHTAMAIIPNDEIRAAFNRTCGGIMGSPGLFGLTAAEAAFKYGDEWLEQVLSYLEANVDYTISYFEKKIPEITPVRPEGTYLVWLDCRRLGMGREELQKFFREKARVGMNDGYTFGSGGEGFMRLNVGCPRKILEEGLRRIEEAVRSLR